MSFSYTLNFLEENLTLKIIFKLFLLIRIIYWLVGWSPWRLLLLSCWFKVTCVLWVFYEDFHELFFPYLLQLFYAKAEWLSINIGTLIRLLSFCTRRAILTPARLTQKVKGCGFNWNDRILYSRYLSERIISNSLPLTVC